MANLSQNDRNIIAEHPLDKCLEHLRDPLRKAEQNYSPGSFPSDGTVNSQAQGPQKAISQLLNALGGHEVAYDLSSKMGNSNIATELSKLFGLVQSGRYIFEHYRALLRLVIKEASDVDIWNAVFDLITTVSQITPPISIPVSSDSTPVTISSLSFQGSKQTRRIIESAMFYEIKGCTYRDIDSFFKKYFEGRRWSSKSKAIYNTMKKKYRGGRWTDFPDPPDEDAVWDWLSRFQDKHLLDSYGIFYTTETTSDLTGGEARRQLDVFIKRRGIENKGKHNWKDLREFDIHEEPEKFIRALAGYAMMDDEELGLDTFTEQDDIGRFITISKDATGKENRMQLEEGPLVKQRAVVCRGTTCFPSSDQANAVKFSWTSDKRPPEADHLRLAREKGVEGIAKLVGYQRITSISELRSGLTFPYPHRFRDGTTSATKSFSQTQPSQSFGPIQNLSISKTSSKRKRKRPGDERGSRKKSKLSQQYEAAQNSGEPAVSLYESDDGKYNNRVFGCLAIAPAGRALSEFAQKQQPEKSDLSVLSAIKELLTALRDAIKAHRSLYLKGNILHRDISENNIIITNPKETGGFAGMLIDLDLAKVLGSRRSGARHQTGTMEFMAIEVLQGIDHSYRHDLESFFYVLLWIVARRAWEREFFCLPVDRPKRNILKKWYTGSFDDIADAKEGNMHINKFEDILKEFPQAFDPVKPLCKTIRGILFPYKNGLLIGTPPGPPEKLYDPIIEAFDNAIADVAAGEGSG
ncbi:hypothetical protein ABVK25_009691 [Lepraria finkii]|uniref:EKC/KEOPS complex subunit BUD32 n=1 Tax=Lepraria finkii TaxID=1340010 RepID=A0ABR4AWT6_9LECA